MGAHKTLFEGYMSTAYEVLPPDADAPAIDAAFRGLDKALRTYIFQSETPFATYLKEVLTKELQPEPKTEGGETAVQSNPDPDMETYPLDTIVYPHAASEETPVTSDEPEPPVLALEEVAGLVGEFSHAEQVFSKPDIFENDLRAVLNSIRNPRGAEVFLRRQGITFDIKNPDGTIGYSKPQTLVEIARALESAGEYVRQLELNAKSDMRNDPSSAVLRDHLFHDEVTRGVTLPINEEYPPVRTHATLVPGSPSYVQAEEVLFPAPQQSGGAKRNFEHVVKDLIYFLELNNSWSGLEVDSRTPYPKKVFNHIEDWFGGNLTAPHIEMAWNNLLPDLINNAEVKDRRRYQIQARYGQLFSALLIERMQADDHLRIRIPKQEDGSWAFIGAWARRGTITVIGKPGPHAGHGMHAPARLSVVRRGDQT